MKKTCLFCGGPGPFSREHVFPEWAAKLLGVERLNTRMQMKNVPDKAWESVRSFGLVVRTVCKTRCNEGWMSQLENLVKPILGPMLLAEGPRELSVDEQMLVAAWLWKVAILHESIGPMRYFTAGERAALVNWNDPPTAGVQMWVGIYAGKHLGLVRGGVSRFTSVSGKKYQGFVTTIALRHFAAQLVAVRRDRVGPQGRPRAQYSFADAKTQLWPPRGAPLQWGGDGSLDDDTFKLWHQRWETPKVSRQRRF